MAKSNPPALADEANATENSAVDVSTAPDDWSFETVVEESATVVIFDSVGDVFIGEYLGEEQITPEKGDPFSRFTFRGRDGVRYAINKSYKLDAGMSVVEKGDWVRITLVKEIETGRGLNPMKDFRVEVKRS